MSHNLFDSLQTFEYGGRTGRYYSLPALAEEAKQLIPEVEAPPAPPPPPAATTAPTTAPPPEPAPEAAHL